MLNKVSFLIAYIVIVSGCATNGAATIPEVNRPLADLQKIAAKSLPLGLRKTSENDRELFSHYFETRDRKFRPAQKSEERRFAHIFILGDRRPYQIDVVVQIERREKDSPTYVEAGTDAKLAKVIRQRIVQHLSKRREDLNFIDDFRVF